MSAVGSFGSLIFSTSSNYVLTPDNFERTRSAEYAEHKIIQRKPKLEFIGNNLQEVSFDIQLNRKLGVNIADMLNLIEKYIDQGIKENLILGSKSIGEFVIVDSKESHRHIIKGMPTVIYISLSLKEYN